MKMDKDLAETLNSIEKHEIEKLRRSYKQNNQFNDYLFKTSEKIFRKLVFPYFRFEIFSRCINDVTSNREYYSHISASGIEKINCISKKLQNICLYLNIALEEFYTMLSFINK